ncbi:ABC transporter ATP-binding protein [soil metagenome]
MIEVRNLCKNYGPTVSLDNVSFSAPQGEVVGFLGPNGAGKSTTMKVLMGLARPTSGAATIGGVDVQKDHQRVHKMVGYLPEQAPVYGDMTLASFLEFMGGIKGLSGRDAKKEMLRTTDLVNLQRERPRLLRNLSKGTRQRAGIAQALLGDPPVLLLDEPTAGLDPSQINDVRELVKSLAGRRTVLVSTHILPEVELTCTRIVIIAAGRVVAEGTPRELVATEESEFIVAVRGSKETFAEAIRGVTGMDNLKFEQSGDQLTARLKPAPAIATRAKLARRIVELGLDLVEMREAHGRLEDICLRAVGKRP